MKVKFVKYNRSYCNCSWKWLNDVEIKKLTMTPDFTKEDQEWWFNNLDSRNDYLIWGIECEGVPIGTIGLKHINLDCDKAEYFGYIGEKKYWSKGIGKLMMEFAIKEAKKINIHNIYLNVLESNERAVKSYIRSGFEIFSDDGECINMKREVN